MLGFIAAETKENTASIIYKTSHFIIISIITSTVLGDRKNISHANENMILIPLLSVNAFAGPTYFTNEVFAASV